MGVNVVSVRTNVCATNRQGLASQHGQIKNGTHQPVPLKKKKKKNVDPDAIVTIIVQGYITMIRISINCPSPSLLYARL